MRRPLPLLAALILLSTPCLAQTQSAALAANKGKSLPPATAPMGPRASATAASAARAAVAPVLDGRTDDPAWA